MKYVELEVGGEYLYSRNTKWSAGGFATIYKATILDLTRRTEYGQEASSGRYITARLEDEDGRRPMREARVAIAQLRGPWEAAIATVRAARKRREEAHETERRKERRTAELLRTLATEYGLTKSGTSCTRLVIDAEEFAEKLLPLLEAGRAVIGA